MNKQEKSKYENLGISENFFKPKKPKSDHKINVEWRSSSTEHEFRNIAFLSSIRFYDLIKGMELRKDGSLPLVFKSPKREFCRFKTIFRMVEELPCTLSVLHRRTQLSKTTLRRYLDKLVLVDVVKKEFDSRCELDIYYLNDDYLRGGNPYMLMIWDCWLCNLPEYKTPKMWNPNPRGSNVKLKIRGRKIKEADRARAVKRKIKEFKRKLSASG